MTRLAAALACLCAGLLSMPGCASFGHGGMGQSSCCDDGSCDSKFKLKKDKSYGCDDGCCDGKFKLKKCKTGKCNECETCKTKKKWKCCSGCGKFGMCCDSLCAHCCARSLAIQEEYPVGAVERAHFHQMQTNGEAMDFILFQKDFVNQSAELTPDGKDKILEIAARMRSAPFPVIVERTYNNADPEVDAHRRAIVAQILTDLGNPDANNRVFVSPAYGPGKHTLEGAPEFYQHTYQGGGNFFGGGGFGGGGFGGGGGGFGGGGFGGGGGGFGGGGFGGGFGI